jgi:putative ABC transport system permease protein
MSSLVFALRQFTQHPCFTALAVFTFALGIGPNAAVFSVVQAVLLRPMPYPEANRLVFVGEWSREVPNMSLSYPNYRDFRDRQQTLEVLGAGRHQGFNLVGPSENERATGAMVSHELFIALGTRAIRGRLPGPDDDRVGAERTVVLRESLWQRLYGGRETVIGESIHLSGRLYTVIGIVPDSFAFPTRFNELFVPLGLFGDEYSNRGSHPGLYGVGRLRTGVTIEQARADLQAVAAQLAEEFPETNAGHSATVKPLAKQILGPVRPALLVLLGAAACVLLIACANVANLQLARALGRRREFAVRAALGASRARLVAQTLAESVVLGLAGCAAGLALGVWALDALIATLPEKLPRLDEVRLDGTVLLVCVAASLITSVLFGLVPAMQAARTDLSETLAQGGRSGSAGHGQGWRAALIVGEFALTALLVFSAGLMMRTLARLHAADLGFATERRLTFNWVLAGADFAGNERRLALTERALERLRALPGVTNVAAANPLPLTGSSNQNGYVTDLVPEPGLGQMPFAETFQVSTDYFATMGVRLIAGRTFTPSDGPEAPPVVVVDTRFAERNFGSVAAALGRRLSYGGPPREDSRGWHEIVGVVAHVQNYALGTDTREQTYLHLPQSPPGFLSFVVQTPGAPAALTSAVRAAMREVEPALPVFAERSLAEYFDQSIGTQRLTVTLLGAFAALALMLAAVGLYGVLSYNVGQRTREIGVRMALGAHPRDVVAMIVRHGSILAGVGLVIGMAAAIGAGRLLRSVLYEVSPLDPASFAAVALVLAGVGAIACWLPSRRATRIDPAMALRTE